MTNGEDHDVLTRLVEAERHNRERTEAFHREVMEDYCMLRDRVCDLEVGVAAIPLSAKDITQLQKDVAALGKALDDGISKVREEIAANRVALEAEIDKKLNVSTLGIWVSLTAILCTVASLVASALVG